ncbi:DUF5694 domain-containing protein [Salinibacter altiplanensis]|uniref:DUF5694 domain-containing protein n=1 Tax=Salinibacter altiplanensis TaxID=1803181 RepID=UPI000C9F826C|nr:DUF5694 domain-containing protein [Salinibacter altiplanensis]
MPLRLLESAALAFLLVLTTPVSAQQTGGAESPLATNLPDSAATKLLVLGSPHLSNVGDRFDPSMIDSVMTALKDFAPQAIAVERLPGRQIAAMERWAGPYRKYVQQDYFGGEFLHHGHLIREQAGWSWHEANRRADSLLTVARSAPEAFSTEDRLALIRSLTAAYRLPSAFLQWKYLSPEERSAQSALPDTTAEDLGRRLTAANETYTIGAQLAHDRGLQRLYPIDYHGQRPLMTEIDSLYDMVMKPIGKELMSDSTIKRTFSLQKSGIASGSLLPLYQHMNSKEWGRARVDLHWKELLRRPMPKSVGSARVAIYETRNLHMVAEIQRMVSQHTGERVLVVVGGSHKLLFDAYLQQMMGVKVIEAKDVISGM